MLTLSLSTSHVMLSNGTQCENKDFSTKIILLYVFRKKYFTYVSIIFYIKCFHYYTSGQWAPSSTSIHTPHERRDMMIMEAGEQMKGKDRWFVSQSVGRVSRIAGGGPETLEAKPESVVTTLSILSSLSNFPSTDQKSFSWSAQRRHLLHERKKKGTGREENRRGENEK